MEGPPTKITKYEMESQYLEGEVMEEEGQEEGQEEWLSEGILTDEDYTAAPEQDSSQDATMTSLDQSTDHLISNSNSQDFSQTFTEPQYHINLNGAEYSHLSDVGQEFDQSGQSFNQTGQEFDQSGQDFDQTGQEIDQTAQQFSQESHQLLVKQSDQNVEQNDGQDDANVGNIEETLNNFENASSQNQSDLPDDLDAFLIRKTCVKKTQEVREADKDSDIDNSTKHSDDGNDTDELLRMLGDKEGKSKETESKPTKKELDEDTTDCEDEYIFEGRSSQALKGAVAVTFLGLRKTPPKAVPEDDITDYSSDEADTIKSMFATRINAKNTTNKTVTKQMPTQNVVKQVVHLVHKQSPQTTQKQQKPVRTYPRKNPQSILGTSLTNNTLNTFKHNDQITIRKTEKRNDETVKKPGKQNERINKVEKKNVEKQIVEKQIVEKRCDNQVKKTRSWTNLQMKKIGKPNDELTIKRKEQTDEETHEPEFLDEDEFDLDEESQRPSNKQTQRIMRPEQMEEDVPTDCDTDSEDDSVYDELPSSDSDTPDDWFTLDIRAERAGDYLPLMGDKAYSLLSKEKTAVNGVISSLCQSMAAISEQASRQAAELRRASSSLSVVQNALRHL